MTTEAKNITLACADGRHGDNRRRHLVGMSIQRIHDELGAGEMFSWEGHCGGSAFPPAAASDWSLPMLACDCDCHTV